jgi:hypothetical protein
LWWGEAVWTIRRRERLPWSARPNEWLVVLPDGREVRMPAVSAEELSQLLGASADKVAFREPGGAEPPQPPACDPPRHRVLSVAARWLPTGERQRWLEEWRAERAEVSARSWRERSGHLAGLVLRGAPALGLALRFHARKERA